MRYLAKNPLLLTYLKTCDLLLPKSPQKRLTTPKKLLLSNIAHMGDVVVASSILVPLKSKYPNLEIGFLLGSWSKNVLEGNPLISKLYIFDHWKLNRSSETPFQKAIKHFKTSQRAIQEIREEGYDTAVELYSYFPNAIPLLARSSIPCRVGYTSGGFGSLLTDPIAWHDHPQSMARYHADLFKIKQLYPPSLIAEPLALPNYYAVLHIGTGDRNREQPFSFWKRILECFAQKNYPVFLTGKGSREKKEILKLISLCKYGVNLCDQLSWKQLVFLIQNAKLLVSLETVVSHIASGFMTPHLLFAPRLQRVWKPDNERCLVVDEKNIIKNLEEVLNHDHLSCE